MISVRFEVNGKSRTVKTHAMARLLDVLREEAGLTGTKEGCGEGECGACSVLIDGELVNSCLVPAIQAQGAKIRTIEGIAGERTAGESVDGASAELHAVQRAFIEMGGAQCGICTPGMVIAAVHLIESTPDPAKISEARIREALAGNLCRCTGYMKIFDAVKKAAQECARERKAGDR